MKGAKTMEINKQLFEEVLSGKLKGIFVLRNRCRFNSSELKRGSLAKPYVIRGFKFLDTGKHFTGEHLLLENNSNLDIVDFIPDTNMKESELTIEIPDGKIVDWDESKKQNKIVLKDKQLTYKDVCEKLFKNKKIFYVGTNGIINSGTWLEIKECICDKNNATTEHQLECILAKNKLANVAKYLNDGWKPQPDDYVFLLLQNADSFSVCPVDNGSCASDCGSVWFKSRKTAQQAIEILGEKTIKLALEPLGI